MGMRRLALWATLVFLIAVGPHNWWEAMPAQPALRGGCNWGSQKASLPTHAILGHFHPRAVRKVSPSREVMDRRNHIPEDAVLRVSVCMYTRVQ